MSVSKFHGNVNHFEFFESFAVVRIVLIFDYETLNDRREGVEFVQHFKILSTHHLKH